MVRGSGFLAASLAARLVCRSLAPRRRSLRSLSEPGRKQRDRNQQQRYFPITTASTRSPRARACRFHRKFPQNR
jgi:hypothetical protein